MIARDPSLSVDDPSMTGGDRHLEGCRMSDITKTVDSGTGQETALLTSRGFLELRLDLLHEFLSPGFHPLDEWV